MANAQLTKAKKAKNDEFYTQYHDIEKEMNAYLEYDESVFRDKTVLLPCDDPEWSNFTKYFAQNFERFGLKKLISTSFASESRGFENEFEPTLFETTNPKYDPEKTKIKGKIFILTRDIHKTQGQINHDDLQWSYLVQDGDFRSREVTKLRDEADIIVTNPPFSLFREFLGWIVEANKKFCIIGNKNCITYKEVFPLIKDNKIWSGKTEWSGGMWFHTADPNNVDAVIEGLNMKNVSSVWFTNIDHGRRHQSIPLMTLKENQKFNKKIQKSETAYQEYDNYDAIEVPFTNAIPSDYDGVMGVPISFLDKYSPEQFEIIDMCSSAGGSTMGEVKLNENGLNIKDKRPLINGKNTFARIIIKHKKS